MASSDARVATSTTTTTPPSRLPSDAPMRCASRCAPPPSRLKLPAAACRRTRRCARPACAGCMPPPSTTRPRWRRRCLLRRCARPRRRCALRPSRHCIRCPLRFLRVTLLVRVASRVRGRKALPSWDVPLGEGEEAKTKASRSPSPMMHIVPDAKTTLLLPSWYPLLPSRSLHNPPRLNDDSGDQERKTFPRWAVLGAQHDATKTLPCSAAPATFSPLLSPWRLDWTLLLRLIRWRASRPSALKRPL